MDTKTNIRTHTFSAEAADVLGPDKAIVLQYFYYWQNANKDNPRMRIDGRVWSYGSVRDINKTLTYYNAKRIQSIITLLEEKGYILSGNYNMTAYDRTKWYTLTDKALVLLEVFPH